MRGNRLALIADFASLKRRSWTAHMAAILAWSSAGSEASVTGMSKRKSSEVEAGNACWRMNRSCSKAGRARAGRCGVESSAFLPAQGLLHEVVRARASEQADAKESGPEHTIGRNTKGFVMLHYSARLLRLRGGSGDLASSWTRSRTRLVCSSLIYDREVRAWTRASWSCHQR